MLGLGAPGIWFSLRRPGPRMSWALACAAGIAMPASVFVIVKVAAPIGVDYVGADGNVVVQSATSIPKIGLIVAGALVPLLLLGGVICLFLMGAAGRNAAQVVLADLGLD